MSASRPVNVAGISALMDDDTPRQRILDAAFSLALEGGMDAMQIRDVAARAGVSTRTLHLHFPTKNFLLLSAVVGRAEDAGAFLPSQSGALTSENAVERAVAVFRPATEGLLAFPHLAAGVISALVSHDELAVPLLRTFRDGVYQRTVEALAPGHATPRDQRVARALSQVWFAALAGWATGAEEPSSVLASVESAARLMLEG